jgi:hypothetical protein
MTPYRAAVSAVIDTLKSLTSEEAFAVLDAARAELGLRSAVRSRIVREIGKENRIQNKS